MEGRNNLASQQKKEGGLYFVLTMLMVMGCAAVLFLFKISESASKEGFQISNRYFVCLAPIGIIATTLFSDCLVRAANKKLVKGIVIFILGFLLLIRLLRTNQFVEFFPPLEHLYFLFKFIPI